MSELKVLTAEEQVANILAADARRVRRLTGLVAGLWGLTMLGVGLTLAFSRSSQISADELFRISQGPLREAVLADRPLDRHTTTEFINRTGIFAYLITERVGVLSLMVVVLAVTTLLNLVLIHASRRATLRQIQASLADISVQLAALRGAEKGAS